MDMIRRIGPQYVFSVHIENPECFEELFDRVLLDFTDSGH